MDSREHNNRLLTFEKIEMSIVDCCCTNTFYLLERMRVRYHPVIRIHRNRLCTQHSPNNEAYPEIRHLITDTRCCADCMDVSTHYTLDGEQTNAYTKKPDNHSRDCGDGGNCGDANDGRAASICDRKHTHTQTRTAVQDKNKHITVRDERVRFRPVALDSAGIRSFNIAFRRCIPPITPNAILYTIMHVAG